MAQVNLIAQGSSTDYGYDPADGSQLTSYCKGYANDHPEIAFTLQASSGKAYTGFVSEEATVIALRSVGKINVYTIGWGRNPTGDGSADLANFPLHAARMRAAGFYVVAVSSAGKASNSAYDTLRHQLQTLYQSMLAAGTIDGLVDLCGDPLYGTQTAANNTAYFPDGQHPTQTVQTYWKSTYFAPAMAAFTKPRYVLTTGA